MDQNEIRNKINQLVKDYFSQEKMEPFLAGKTKIQVGAPAYDHHEINEAIDSLLTVWISQGPKVSSFEGNYADYCGVKHGVAVNSGSSANLLAIDCMIKSGKLKKGSEVIVPAATFTTVVSPIIQNDLKPVFVDVDNETFNISASAIDNAITDKTGLILIVHSLGCPAEMQSIMEIAEQRNILVMEDCCEAHAAKIDGKVVGSIGDIGAYSFFVAHNMTTGEGGMVITNDDELDNILRSTREFGRLKDDEGDNPRFWWSDGHLNEYDERYIFERIGYNVRMTDICASLGIQQLKKLDELTEKRRVIAQYFDEQLKKYESVIRPQKTPENGYHSYYGYTLLIDSDAPFRRADLVRFLEDHNIETRAFMGGNLAAQPAYRDHDSIRIADDLEVTKHIADNAFFIGCHPKISSEAMAYVIEVFEDFMTQNGIR